MARMRRKRVEEVKTRRDENLAFAFDFLARSPDLIFHLLPF